MMGRPEIYTDELAEKVLEWIRVGYSVAKIAKMDDMPAKDTIFQWIVKRPDFADRYVQAKETGAFVMAEEIVEISDNDQNDVYFKEEKDGSGLSAKPCFDVNNINRDRLRVDSRKWILAKLVPKKYGDFQRNENTTTSTVKIESMDDSKLDAKLAQLLGKAGITPVITGEGTTEAGE